MPVSISKLRMIAGAVVVAAAGGSGFYMQTSQPVKSGSPAPARVASAAVSADKGPLAPAMPMQAETPVVTRAAAQPVFLTPEVAPLLPVPGKHEVGSLTPISAEPAEPATVPERAADAGEPAVAATECEVGFTANAAPGAMVELTLEAPCYANQNVDFFHAGTRFTASLDARGLTQASVPALEEDAFFNVLFADGRTEATDILMLTAQDYQRFALFWKGQTGFAIYALERGAEYGEAGMVSKDQPYDAQRAISGEGGFFSALGTTPDAYHTMVYSWPVRLNDSGPAPEVSLEAEVLAGNCGTEITASLLTTMQDGPAKTAPLFMDVPGCDAVGQYLVLKNPALPVRIATN